jgi:hypothetical protein
VLPEAGVRGPFRNRNAGIVYNSAEAGRAGEAGLRVWIDGRLAAHRDTFGELTVDPVGIKGL